MISLATPRIESRSRFAMSSSVSNARAEALVEEKASPRKPMPLNDSLISQQYLEQLMREKSDLIASTQGYRHLGRLLDSEINRVVSALSENLASTVCFDDFSQRVTLTEKINVPVDKYPNYNFVGRILGPRGMTAKQLEEETGCKIMVRGRGACRTEPLHILVHCEDHPERVEQRLKNAVAKINSLLSPPPEGKDELKRKQLIELSIINGTYRPTPATKLALQTPRVGSSSPFNEGGFPSTLGEKKSFSDDPYSSSSLFNYSSSLFNYQNFTNEYYKNLIAMMSADPSILSSMYTPPHELFSSLTASAPNSVPSPVVPPPPPAHASHSTIPPANYQQYLAAASMLNNMPFHDGSGDQNKAGLYKKATPL